MKISHQNETQIRKILEDLISRLKKLVYNSKPLLSEQGEQEVLHLSIIGKDVHRRRIDHVMDIDTLIVLKDPMDDEKLRAIESIFHGLSDFRNDKVSVTFEIADGPIKPLPFKKINIFFHVLLHTVETYRSSPLILVKNSWQYDSNIISGNPVRNIQRIQEPTLDQIIGSPLGIEHCIRLINEKSSAYLKWNKVDNSNYLMELTPIEFKERCELIELVMYSILRCASNSLRYVLGYSRNIGIDYDSMFAFSELFSGFKYKDLPIDTCKRKVELRRGEWYPKESDVVIYTEQGLEFLESLLQDIIKRAPAKEYINELAA